MSPHAASIPVIGFNAVLMSEHFGAFLAWGVLHAAVLVRYVRGKLSRQHFALVAFALAATAGLASVLAVVGVLAWALQSPTFGWTGAAVCVWCWCVWVCGCFVCVGVCVREVCECVSVCMSVSV